VELNENRGPPLKFSVSQNSQTVLTSLTVFFSTGSNSLKIQNSRFDIPKGLKFNGSNFLMVRTY